MAFVDNFSTPATALAALQAYSIIAASAATDYKFADSDSASVNVGGSAWTHTILDVRQRIGHATFKKTLSQQEAAGRWNRINARGAQSILVEVKIGTKPPKSLPIFFLPWNGGGGVMQLTIPPVPLRPPTGPPLTDDDHPRYFFTAALSGCSIFFKGTPQSPTILHAGIDGETPGADARTHWLDVVDLLERQGRLAGAVNREQVHNVDYAVTKRGAQGQGKTDADQVEASLTNLLSGSYTIEHTRPWGAVFGIRTGNDWQFFLQQNITIDYYKLKTQQRTKTKMFGLVKKTITEIVKDGPDRSVSRPIVTRPIFPGGGGTAVALMQSWRSTRD